MDEQPITEGVAPSENQPQGEMSEELKSTDCLKDSNIISNKTINEDKDTDSLLLENNSLDSVHNDIPNSKHSADELNLQSQDLDINNYEDKCNYEDDDMPMTNSTTNENCEELHDKRHENSQSKVMELNDDASSPNEVNKIDEELNSDNNIVTNPTIESDIDNEAVTSENTANYAESEQNFDADEYTNSAEDPIEAKNIEESYDENSVTNQDENGSENNESVAIELEKNDEDNTTTDISNENELDNAKDDQCSEDKLDKDHSDNESENKKQTEDNEMGPDFECSDFKEHVPSDDKPDHNDKSTHEEDKELDPFDQVVNEPMDIDDASEKQNKDTGSSEKSDENNENDTHVDDILEKETTEEMQVDPVNEETEEVQDVDASKGADEEVCLLPDTDREISEADKERAILAKESLAKEAANKDTQDSTSTEGDNAEKSDEVTNKQSSVENLPSPEEVVNNSEDSKPKISSNEQNDSSSKDNDDKEVENETIDIIEAETEVDSSEPLKENVILQMTINEQNCAQCVKIKPCKFHMLVDGSMKYLCQKDCVLKYKEDHDDYEIVVKKVIIKEIVGTEHSCLQCTETKICQYEIFKEGTFLCSDSCLQKHKDGEFSNFVIKYRKIFVQEITPSEHVCTCCEETKQTLFQYSVNNQDKYICDNECLSKLQERYPEKYRVKVRKLFRVKEMPRLLNVSVRDINEGPKIVTRTEEAAEAAKLDRDKSFLRKCTNCEEVVNGTEKNLNWETMDFCSEDCLSNYQNASYSNCSNCKVEVHTTSLGKYCVRFGYDVRQFCSSSCLEEFKKGLKVCSYCQKDISGGSEGFLAPVGDKGQFKDFCTQTCMEKFDQMSKNSPPLNVVNQCAVCKKEKVVKVEIFIGGFDHKLCSNPCFSAFKFVNKLYPDQCDMCKKYYERKSSEHYTIYEDSTPHTFCSKTCMNVFILSNRHIVPCNWCKVKKYNYDMIRRNLNTGKKVMMCSLNCLTLYQVSVNAVSMRRIKCDHCKSLSQAQYHLTMSDATIRNFCTYQCVMSFQGQYSKSPITLGNEQHKVIPVASMKGAPVPTGAPKRTYNITRQAKGVGTKAAAANKSYETPIISKVRSLIPPVNSHNTRGSVKTNQKAQVVQQAPPPPTPAPPPVPPPKPQFKTQLIVKPPPPKPVANMSTMCKPMTSSKGTSCRQQSINKDCQTDDSLQKKILIPVPIPIYVPTPLNMYSLPYPVPVPIPLPIPIPVFIPTTRNSANGIMKEIKKIHEKMPTDPFEAELLMMAEMVAGEKKRSDSDSDSDDDAAEDDGFSPEAIETSNTFGEDMLQMALKMASEYEEPAVDLESAMTASTITPSSHPPMPNEEGVDDPNPMQHHHHMIMMEQQRAAMRGRKRPNRPPSNSLGPNKRNRRVSNTDGLPMMQPPTQPEPPREPTEKPDANMCLKYTFGVNAWKQWVMTKNADLEKSSIRRKPFKSEILQLTADELNYSLCLFVKEVRKPNGSEYAPDTIYYLVLGIQQYLFENGRIDNIFTDAYYEKFTECLDEVAKKFSVLYNDSQYIVTRVEEEHLWESKQLGAHSPHVLLSTLMFFNTKHFNLVTVEEHMQLSFSHIMKHWKRNPNQPGATKVPGSRNVLLRFYPPQSALDANSRKKKVYEQQENEENPLRCPVKLYEFYLSKCPESVKTRNDVFYLLPERSCVPDSPVWYSTMALGKEPLQKMLHRVKMVKEINIALLTS